MSASRSSTANPPGPPDFSVPWKCSDVVLVVERQKFHVHRYTLAMWSPVFEKMFTSELKEKNSCEIPLPGKKASEIKELLLIIYPTKSGKAWKTVTNENCYFLLKLADEYQMEDVRKKCEDVLVNLVSKKPGNTFLADLTLAQTYKLDKLLGTIVNRARQLRLCDFKSHVPLIALQTILQQSDLIIDDMRKERDALRAQVTTFYSIVCIVQGGDN